MGYLPGMWHDFGVTIGPLAGALTGLLFVAVSIKSDTLAESGSLRSRAAQTLVLFMTSALAAILLVAPQPGTRSAGNWSRWPWPRCGLVRLGPPGGHDPTSRSPVISSVRHRTRLRRCSWCRPRNVPLTAGGGLFWLIPAAVSSLVGGVINAWLFLVRA